MLLNTVDKIIVTPLINCFGLHDNLNLDNSNV